MDIQIHMIAKVANGYEYFYTIFDDEGKVLAGNQTSFIGPKYPTDDEVNDWKTKAIENYQQQLLEPESIEESVSDVDQELVNLKYSIKAKCIEIIKANNSITQEDLVTAITKELGSVAGSFTPGFLAIYEKEAYDRRLIKNITYEDLRTFIISTPVAKLMEIK